MIYILLVRHERRATRDRLKTAPCTRTRTRAPETDRRVLSPVARKGRGTKRPFRRQGGSNHAPHYLTTPQ